MNAADLHGLLDGLLPALGEFAGKLILSALLLLIGIKLIGFVRSRSRKSFERMKFDAGAGRFLSSCLSVALYGILFFTVAGTLGVNSASIVALLGSAGIAISLAVQGSLSNFAGGVLLLLTKPFVVGDYIVNQDGEGTVSSIGIIYTTLITVDNRKIVLPNGTLANSPLTNLTSQDKRRAVIRIKLPYEEDLERAKELIRGLFLANPGIMKNEEVDAFVDALDDDGAVLCVRGYALTEHYWKVQWELNEAVKLALDKAGIRIASKRLAVCLEEKKKR